MNTPARQSTARRRTVSLSRVFVLLFISTEAMFFAALFAVYLILRVASGSHWPTQDAVHVERWVGLLNTLILLASSWTMSMTVAAVGRDQPARAKKLLWATIGLGTLFLIIKGGEYAVKIDHGLVPRKPQMSVFSHPDVEYLAAVARSIQLQRAARTGDDPALAQLDRLKSGLVDWTGKIVMQSANPLRRSMALQALAFSIQPAQSVAPGATAYLRTEAGEVSRELAALTGTKTELLERIEQLNQQLTAAAEPSGDGDQTRVATQQIENQLAVVRDQLTQVNSRWIALDDRNWVLGQLHLPDAGDASSAGDSSTFVGLNRSMDLGLPYVIPNGPRWISCYWMLTGFHALHLVGGLVAMLILAVRRLGVARFNFAHNLASYWHFVDGVWLIVFATIYLL